MRYLKNGQAHVTIPIEQRHESMESLIKAAFGQLTKVPRSLLTTHNPHKVQVAGIDGGEVTFQKRGKGKNFLIVGIVGPFETTVYQHEA